MWSFKPNLKQVIWGGEKIIPFRRLNSNLDKIGESWEISAVDGMESIVADAGEDYGLTLTSLVEKYNGALLGEKNFERFGNNFPILVKFIDAGENLSVQVHPDDETARNMGAPRGKNEFWYVLESDNGACIANGLTRSFSREEYVKLIESGDIMNYLTFHNVKKGDRYFIPAGRVHAIGKGTFLLEIQQTSDLTFRIYDYDRIDKKTGKKRPLQTEEAFDAIKFNEPKTVDSLHDTPCNGSINLVNEEFFTINLVKGKDNVSRSYKDIDSFVIVTCLEGNVKIKEGDQSRQLQRGDSILIAATAESVEIESHSPFELVETFIL